MSRAMGSSWVFTCSGAASWHCERDQGERGKGCPLASSRGWTTPKCIREPSGYSNP